MSTVPFHWQQQLSLDAMFSQLEQQWSFRDQVAKALKEANAAFAAQYTQPDGFRYMQACDDLGDFLGFNISLEYSEQQLVVQALQIACAMHENVVNNPTLTPTQRSCHYLATTSLVPLCKRALEGSVTYADLWWEVYNLTERAEQALVRATDALGLSRYLGWANTTDGNSPGSGYGSGSGSVAGEAIAAPLPVPAVSPRTFLSDTVPDDWSNGLKHKALAILKEQPYRATPLGRRHSLQG